MTQNKIIILYYSPSCGHCIKLLPVWEEFVERNNTKLTIKTINCNNQECNVEGFPTIILHKSDGSTVYFNGERTVNELEKFIS